MKVTKYIITSPECTDILPSDISTIIYESGYGVKVKETCFGAIIEGEEQPIKSLVEEIRALDPAGIFIKDRGFSLGDLNHCRGSDSGSPPKIVGLTERKCSARLLHDRGRVKDVAADITSLGFYSRRRIKTKYITLNDNMQNNAIHV